MHSIFFRTNASVYAENETITFTKKGQIKTIYVPEQYALGNIKVLHLDSRLEVVSIQKGTKIKKQGEVKIKWKETEGEGGGGVTSFVINSNSGTSSYAKSVTVELHNYKLTARYNGGKDDDGKTERTVWEGGYDNIYKIPSKKVKVVKGLSYKEVTVTRDGYKFLGWSTNKDATKPNLKEGESFSVNKIEELIYAVWEPINSSSGGNNASEGGISTKREALKYSDGKNLVAVGDIIKLIKGNEWNVYSDSECTKLVSKNNVKAGVEYEVTYVAPNRVGLKQCKTEIGFIIWANKSDKAMGSFMKVNKSADSSSEITKQDNGNTSDNSEGTKNNLNLSEFINNENPVINIVTRVLEWIVNWIKNNLPTMISKIGTVVSTVISK